MEYIMFKDEEKMDVVLGDKAVECFIRSRFE